MSNPVPRDHHEKLRQQASKLTAHRDKATWGDRLVPLAHFRQAAARAGRAFSPAERSAAIDAYRAAINDPSPVEGPYRAVAVFGGIYNNSYALRALLADAPARGVEALYCLGDLGGFGPNPEAIRPLLERGEVLCIQGNYEESLSSGRDDCNCGYADPRDNYYAALSYDYTAARCSGAFKAWMGTLPMRRRIQVGDRELLLVHGSPRRINEFLFASASPVPFLETLLDQNHCDGMLCTHTGLPWHRRLPSGRDVVNVGALGRPANDGRTEVWYCILRAAEEGIAVELVPLAYDHHGLVAAMRDERLPEPFVETILTGWWTTCLEILPARERAASKL